MSLKAFFLVVCALTGLGAFSQQANFAGLNLNAEQAGSGFMPGFGLLLERKQTGKSGLETGVYYRQYIRRGQVLYGGASSLYIYSFAVAEQYLSVPFLYKRYTRYFTVSAGPSIDVYTGWKKANKGNEVPVQDYSLRPKASLGILAKAGKRFAFGKDWILEPELRFNHLFRYGRTAFGFGISGRYRFPVK